MREEFQNMCDAESLRASYGQPSEPARLKTLSTLDTHCRRFIALSPFLCLGTQGPNGADVSPRGDKPGFVLVLDDSTFAIPDWRGNNRIDSLTNIISNPQVGLLFLIPGVEETLRVNGVAHVSMNPELLARYSVGSKRNSLAYAWARIDDATIRVRFFFTKYGSVIEDPGTGSACANLGGWFVAQGAKLPLAVKVLQGDQVGRPCRIGLRVDTDKRIFVSGRVIALGSGEISL